MKSLEQSLISGEEIEYRGGLHWVVLLQPLLITALLAVGGGAMIYEGQLRKEANLSWLIWPGIAFLCLGLFFLLRGILRRGAVHVAVTNKRIILSRGLVDRQTQEILLQKVESIVVDQGPFARMLDYGTVTVRGTGGSYEPFPHVAHPVELRRAVQEQIAAKP